MTTECGRNLRPASPMCVAASRRRCRERLRWIGATFLLPRWEAIPSAIIGSMTITSRSILIDVTGHGLDSALLSVSINNVIRSGSLPGADMRRPDQVLASLNESFQGRQHSNKFFTIWYGVYWSSTRVLTWSGGGHHASLLFAPDAPASVFLSSTGPMMGILRGANFPANSCLVPHRGAPAHL